MLYHEILRAKLKLYQLLCKKQDSWRVELSEPEVNMLFNLSIDRTVMDFIETQKKIKEA